MVEEHYDYLTHVAAENQLHRTKISRIRRVINTSSENIHRNGLIPTDWLPAKLVLTSPPYPGVHVLYHRWQVNGRKETAAPFWIANSRDGAGEAYYTLGGRKETELKTYFNRLGGIFNSVRKVVNSNSMVAQLVAFSEPQWQLAQYLSVMEKAGFREIFPLCEKKYLHQGRLWRIVPGRKWYAKNSNTESSNEVLLLHRPV
jgi:hypothetical protein